MNSTIRPRGRGLDIGLPVLAAGIAAAGISPNTSGLGQEIAPPDKRVGIAINAREESNHAQ